MVKNIKKHLTINFLINKLDQNFLYRAIILSLFISFFIYNSVFYWEINNKNR